MKRFEVTPGNRDKIIQAIQAASCLKERKVRCPYCNLCAIIVYEDARGHVRTKCSRCKQEVIIDVVAMRNLKRNRAYA